MDPRGSPHFNIQSRSLLRHSSYGGPIRDVISVPLFHATGPLRGLLPVESARACGMWGAGALSLSLSPFAARCERPSALERLLWLILVHHLLHLLELIIHCRGQHTLGRLECRELVVDAAAGLERFKLVIERRAFA